MYVTRKRPGCQKPGSLKMHCRPLTEIILHILILGGKDRGLREEDMAARFKLPSLPKKRRRAFEFPKFSWNSVKIKEELGSGIFGSVYLADFKFGEVQRHVCIQNLKGESADSKGRASKRRQVSSIVSKATEIFPGFWGFVTSHMPSWWSIRASTSVTKTMTLPKEQLYYSSHSRQLMRSTREDPNHGLAYHLMAYPNTAKTTGKNKKGKYCNRSYRAERNDDKDTALIRADFSA